MFRSTGQDALQGRSDLPLETLTEQIPHRHADDLFRAQPEPHSMPFIGELADQFPVPVSDHGGNVLGDRSQTALRLELLPFILEPRRQIGDAHLDHRLAAKHGRFHRIQGDFQRHSRSAILDTDDAQALDHLALQRIRHVIQNLRALVVLSARREEHLHRLAVQVHAIEAEQLFRLAVQEPDRTALPDQQQCDRRSLEHAVKQLELDLRSPRHLPFDGLAEFHGDRNDGIRPRHGSSVNHFFPGLEGSAG